MLVELLKERVREIKMKLEGITASLEEYVKELGQWMGEAKKYINDVKEYVNRIMQQLDGENKKKIDQAAADIDSVLDKKVKELNEWIEKAEAAVNVAKDKAANVYERLNKDDKDQKISQGIDKITTANEKVRQVSTQLETVHEDLVDWKNAAEDVLREAAGKADEVSGQLDPAQKGACHPIGENLNRIDTSNAEITKANEQLTNQVDKLNTWITDADDIRKKAENKAQEVYDSLTVHKELSEKINEIQAANKEIKDVNSELSGVDEKLRDWNKEAESVIQGVVEKAEQIYEKLDHEKHENDGTMIGKGIKQIKEAKANVEAVDNGLKSVNDDLQKWREAAKHVLGSAVDKASEVHTALDPAKDKSTLGKQIDAIDTARKAIVDANTALGQQVKSLNTWINEAEKIRAAAETKAKEAYDKLSVHEALSKNVKRIVDANNAINGVYSAVDAKVKDLGRWNEQAKKVLDGAIGNAKEVHDKLRDYVDLKVKEIGDDNNDIIEANKQLAAEVANLCKWNKAARKVIEMADKKCDEILKRVKTDPNSQSDTIYKQASSLKDSGTKLLQAATDAKQKVESTVKDALDAVKAMDSDLKKDLKVVKDKIKDGIKEVISKLKVDKLGEKVKQDLQKLREKIVKLGENGKVESLVEKELAELDEKNKLLQQRTIQIKGQTEKEMEQNFRTQIKEPLDSEIQKVTQAIRELYKNFEPDSVETKDTINDIIGHIKNKVENILKGEGESKDKGMQGIANGLENYAKAFDNDKHPDWSTFENIVEGWISDSVIMYNGLVKAQLKALNWNDNDFKKDHRGSKITTAAAGVKNRIGEKIQNRFKTYKISDLTGTLSDKVEKVKTACEDFAQKLDQELNKGNGNSDIVSKVNQVAEVKDTRRRNSLTASEAVLCALSTASRQVSKEIQSILLDSRVGTNGKKTSVAAELDRVLNVNKKLHDNLEEATKKDTSEEIPVTGTADAVDKAIEKVRENVKGLDGKFESDVKTPVKEAVQGLEQAVTDYDPKAKEQVKEAAKGAITAAANVISDNDISAIELQKAMPNFSREHNKIQSQLPNNLRASLDTYIGSDDTRHGKRDQVKLSRDFKKYFDHVYTGVITNFPHGKRATAIGKIEGEGLREINKYIDKYADERIDETVFTGAFAKIERELEDIKKLVSHSGFFGRDDKGVKNLLQDLRTGLDSGTLDGASEKGLKNILSAIGGLLKGRLFLNPLKLAMPSKPFEMRLKCLRRS